MHQTIIDDLDALLDVLPPVVSEPLRSREDRCELLEVVLDLGRVPEARFINYEVIMSQQEVTHKEIEYVTSRIGAFGEDNRAGIARTLHRVSALRNRQGRIIGLTCRVGRAVFGTIKLIEDLVESGKSILLLGRPGVGKTTMLREVARVLADDFKKRVIIVDTSNEIAGDGDIPHPAIGHARRMQVVTPLMQHAVMIEAVENHMPQAIVIDEIGTELEAMAARTIAERGVQLVGTAHGNTLDNLIFNPTLADLVGGIQTVTLSDEEARRRRTQKSILERKAPPTFDVLVEIQGFNRVAVHPEVAEVVDAILRGRQVTAQVRWLDEHGRLQKKGERLMTPAVPEPATEPERVIEHEAMVSRIYPFGINQSKLRQVAKEKQVPVSLTTDLREADLLVTSKTYYRRKPQKVRDAEAAGIPVYVLKSSAIGDMRQFLESVTVGKRRATAIDYAMKETEDAIAEVMGGREAVLLSPRSAYIRRMQHLMAERYRLSSRSSGKEPQRRVEIFRGT